MKKGQSLRFLLLCFIVTLSLRALHIPDALAASDKQSAISARQNDARETLPALAGQKRISEVSSRSKDCTTNPTMDCFDSQLQFPTAIKSSVQNPIAPQFTLLFFTPLDMTTGNIQIINIWGASLTIVNIFVVVILVLHGLNIIVSGTIFRYAQAIETIPGVLLALVAANCSLIFIHFFAALNGAFCIDIYVWASGVQNIPDKGLLDALVLVPKTLNFDNISLQNIIDDFGNVMPLIKDVLSAMLLGQIVIRLVFFAVYIVLAPIGLACWSLPGKVGQPITRLWFSGFTTTVMSQSVQVIAIIVVEFSLGPIMRIFTAQISGNIIDPGLLNDVVHIAFLWFIIQVTGIFESAPARAIVEIGGAITEATGAIIGSQIVLQQIMGESFVSTASLGISVGARSIRRGLTSGGDQTSEVATGSRRRRLRGGGIGLQRGSTNRLWPTVPETRSNVSKKITAPSTPFAREDPPNLVKGANARSYNGSGATNPKDTPSKQGGEKREGGAKAEVEKILNGTDGNPPLGAEERVKAFLQKAADSEWENRGSE